MIHRNFATEIVSEFFHTFEVANHKGTMDKWVFLLVRDGSLVWVRVKWRYFERGVV
jgi:hypothetical protein